MIELQSFGYWLHQRRKELGMTQDELARRVGYATITIRKLEANKLIPSRQMAELLIPSLEIPTDEHKKYVEFARGGKPVLRKKANLYPNNLPVVISGFYGRKKEIEVVCALLKKNRLVTLIGAGGTGKTRLALRCAEEMVDQYPQGVWFVNFASLTDQELVLQTIAVSLELGEGSGYRAILINSLRDKNILLLLDNCEQLLEAVPQIVNDLLLACPLLIILATSRERLGVAGETAYRVPSMPFPDPKKIPALDVMIHFDAIQLFKERAAAVLPDFTITKENAVAVARICERLDGIPLAIELAAVRIRMMTASQIASRLENAFSLLTDGSRIALLRQQTIKATIDWSYELLSQSDKLLLHRLSVFIGGWTLDAAEQVCSDLAENERMVDELARNPWSEDRLKIPDILDLLGHLVDKSMVSIDLVKTGEGRYHMLEMVRQYAHAKLVDTDCEIFIRNRHLDYFIQLALQAKPHLRSIEQGEWMGRLEDDLDNLRQALEWSLYERIVDGLKMVADLHQFWHVHGHTSEGINWHEKLLSAETLLPDNGDPATRASRRLARAQALQIGWMESVHNPHFTPEKSMAKLVESVTLCRELGPTARYDLAISLLMTAYYQNLLALSQAGQTLQESLDISREIGDSFNVAECLWLGFRIPLENGDLKKSRDILRECLSFREMAGDQDGEGSCLYTLALFAILDGDYKKAERFFEESLTKLRIVQNQWSLAILEYYRSLLARAKGEYSNAIKWGEEAVSIYRELDEKLRTSLWLCGLGMTAWASEDYQMADHWGKEAIKIAEVINSEFPMAAVQHLLGRIALSQGDLTMADHHFKEMYNIYGKTKAPIMILEPGIKRNLLELAYMYETLAVLASAKGQMKRAAILFSTVQEWERSFLGIYCPKERKERQASLHAAQQSLGEASFQAAWQEGQTLTLDQVKDEVSSMFN